MVSIFKSEKGAGALKKLQEGSQSQGGMKVKGGPKAGAKPKSAKKASTVKAASKVISKIGGGDKKKSVGKVGGKVPSMRTPGVSGSSVATPKVNMSNFAQMKKFL